MEESSTTHLAAFGKLWLWLLKMILAWVPILAPALAYIATVSAVSGHAKSSYFNLVAQILPILVLALAIEQRYFFKEPRLPKPPSAPDPLPQRGRFVLRVLYPICTQAFNVYLLLAYVYPLLILTVLSMGEFRALQVAATGHAAEFDLQSTAGSLAAGFTALVFSLMAGNKRPGEEEAKP